MNRILSVIASQSYTTKLNVSAQFKHQITYKKIGGRYEKKIHGKNMKKIANKLQQKFYVQIYWKYSRTSR